jgi:hypothetical protein
MSLRTATGVSARVVNTRDNPRPSPSAEQFYAARDKNSFNRTQPLKPSDLRMKAQLRDTNLQASRKMLLADGSGKVYQKAPGGDAKMGREASG